MTKPKLSSNIRSVRLPERLDATVQAYCAKFELTYAQVVRDALHVFLSTGIQPIQCKPTVRGVTTASYITAEDLEKNTWCALNADKQVVAYSVDAPNAIGVAYHDALAGETLTVVTSGWER
jgi:hypothetical protein